MGATYSFDQIPNAPTCTLTFSNAKVEFASASSFVSAIFSSVDGGSNTYKSNFTMSSITPHFVSLSNTLKKIMGVNNINIALNKFTPIGGHLIAADLEASIEFSDKNFAVQPKRFYYNRKTPYYVHEKPSELEDYGFIQYDVTIAGNQQQNKQCIVSICRPAHAAALSIECNNEIENVQVSLNEFSILYFLANTSANVHSHLFKDFIIDNITINNFNTLFETENACDANFHSIPFSKFFFTKRRNLAFTNPSKSVELVFAYTLELIVTNASFSDFAAVNETFNLKCKFPAFANYKEANYSWSCYFNYSNGPIIQNQSKLSCGGICYDLTYNNVVYKFPFRVQYKNSFKGLKSIEFADYKDNDWSSLSFKQILSRLHLLQQGEFREFESSKYKCRNVCIIKDMNASVLVQIDMDSSEQCNCCIHVDYSSNSATIHGKTTITFNLVKKQNMQNNLLGMCGGNNAKQSVYSDLVIQCLEH